MAKMRGVRLRSLCSLILFNTLTPRAECRTDCSVARYSLLPRPRMGTFGVELKPGFSDLMVSGWFHRIRTTAAFHLHHGSVACPRRKSMDRHGGRSGPLGEPTFDHLSKSRRAHLIHPARCTRENLDDAYSIWRPPQPFCQVTDTGIRCYGNEDGVIAFVATES